MKIIIPILLTLCGFVPLSAQVAKVELKETNGKFTLLRDGKPYYVNGVGGHKFMDRVVKYNGNTLRTWGTDGIKDVLDEAHKFGLTVMVGLWVQHERHGFDYDDEEKVAMQLEKFKDVVTSCKDHPAVLLWGIGNEVDLFYKNTKVWKAVGDIAKMIHELDPNHPTATVTAGFDPKECELIRRDAPDIDIYCVNAYGGAGAVPQQIKDAGWPGPYMVTEWGPQGHWEVPVSKWGAEFEPSSTEKHDLILKNGAILKADSNKCLGHFIFNWGNKQERTPTWYSMFLENGEETPSVDAIHYVWNEKYPNNRAPLIEPITIKGQKAPANVYLETDQNYVAVAPVKDPDEDPLMYEWFILPESTDKRSGGDREEKPKPVEKSIYKTEGNKCYFRAPYFEGGYRIFCYVYDGKNNIATANLPFYVE